MANQIIVIMIQEIATFYTMFKEENKKIEKEDLKEKIFFFKALN